MCQHTIFPYWIPRNSYSSNRERFTLGKDIKHLLIYFLIHFTFKGPSPPQFCFRLHAKLGYCILFGTCPNKGNHCENTKPSGTQLTVKQ